ncbi:hypothetical protein BD289DRAFT_420360 [Coniella lustricola]|uniref:Tat pathway signal sequence n=1 Tax=Coniella lustricola TaxID=2025994 RepID=A0A2T3AN46_9PEZI|nr:hypothetical protein BD289DRAFT_420360 [Coniella lustricola]
MRPTLTDRMANTTCQTLHQLGIKTSAALTDDDVKDSERFLAAASTASDMTLRDSGELGLREKHLQQQRRRKISGAAMHFTASLCWLLGVLLVVLAFGRNDGGGGYPSDGIFGWSPVVQAGANEYVEYTFPYFDVDPGQELWNNKPNYEQDVRWLESYNWLARIPNKDAEKIPNRTIKIPGDEEHSVVWLGVFHELHCLNILRKLIWFEYYSVMSDLVAGRNNMRNHLVHCVDAIRKASMCHADITPIPLWSEPDFKKGEITPVFKVPHTCRNYDRIKEWAVEHRVDDGLLKCPDEDMCGALNAITMKVPPGDPQPTHWPDPTPAPLQRPLTQEQKEILQCDKSYLDWC